MRRPPLPAPPVRQTYALCWLLGLLAGAWPLPCLLLLAVLLGLDPRLCPWRHPARTLLALLLFAAGWLPARQHLTPPPSPAWHTAALADAPARDRPRLCGHIRSVNGLPDDRLRLLLEDVRPEGSPEAAPLPGLVAWTWDEPAQRPLAGQTVCLRAPLRPVHGQRNEGMQDWSLWWRAQGVHWRLWSRGERADVRLEGDGSRSGRWRQAALDTFVLALLPPSLRAGDPAEQTAWLAARQGQAALPALLFGDRQYLSRDTLDDLAAASLLHSLALSGQHLALAGLLGLGCVLAAARLRPSLYLLRPRLSLSLLASCPPALLYLWLGNAPPSLVRAACMLFCLTLSLLFLTGRTAGPFARLAPYLPHTTLDCLLAALTGICLVSPTAVFDTGLQLSVLCLLAIGLALPVMRRLLPAPHETDDAPSACDRPARCRALGRHLFHRAAQLFFLSFAIQLVLLPLNVLLFGNAGHWFFLNLLWLPVLGCFVLPAAACGLVLSLCGLTGVAHALLSLSALPAQWLLDGLDVLAAQGLLSPPLLPRPHWAAIPGMLLCMTALARILSHAKGRLRLHGTGRLLTAGLLLLAGSLLPPLAARLFPEIRLDVLDVGQAQAVVLRVPGPHAGDAPLRLLIDGAGSFSAHFDAGKQLVAPILLYTALPRLHAVINSHPDLDHMGGLPFILRHFRVERFYDNGRPARGGQADGWNALRQQLAARPLARGDRLPLGDPEDGLVLEVLHPPRTESERWTGNDASLVLRLTRHGHGLLLLPGDAEKPALRELLASGQDLRAEVLVAPHHGSAGSFLPAFYEAVQPREVLVSCGFMNRFRYPARKLREWLAERRIPLRRTDEDGQLTVRWSVR
ncbi:ComEC/Rec2 family competence protein [uncultured Desulfovibrio sp.]|uniref:ComEC/Rec2 family competence protein n=1 Tax=uncultured Desulfovibrio sp. TaxID=167968 RepID=UPI002636F51E|nr:ComEC/Rec2 family competence protein [uncultured Desulfovibrio sp.]